MILAYLIVALIAPDADPPLVLAVMRVESRFRHHGFCYRGAYGIMQLQVKGRRECNARSRRAAERGGYLDLATNVRLGVKALGYWRRWCESRKHRGHHWLLHYNQGYGRCPKGRERCRAAERRVDPRLDRYSKKVLFWQERYRRRLSWFSRTTSSKSAGARPSGSGRR